MVLMPMTVRTSVHIWESVYIFPVMTMTQPGVTILDK